MVFAFRLKMRERLLGLLEDILLPREQLRAEIVALALVHERLFVGWLIILALVRQDRHAVSFLRRHRFPVSATKPAPARRAYNERKCQGQYRNRGSPECPRNRGN